MGIKICKKKSSNKFGYKSVKIFNDILKGFNDIKNKIEGFKPKDICQPYEFVVTCESDNIYTKYIDEYWEDYYECISNRRTRGSCDIEEIPEELPQTDDNYYGSVYVWEEIDPKWIMGFATFMKERHTFEYLNELTKPDHLYEELRHAIFDIC